jgi:hypothetical protein
MLLLRSAASGGPAPPPPTRLGMVNDKHAHDETSRPLLGTTSEPRGLGASRGSDRNSHCCHADTQRCCGVRSAASQEAWLLWELAWPLFFQTLASEVQMVLTTALFGHLGTTDLAAANDTQSMVWYAPPPPAGPSHSAR